MIFFCNLPFLFVAYELFPGKQFLWSNLNLKIIKDVLKMSLMTDEKMTVLDNILMKSQIYSN